MKLEPVFRAATIDGCKKIAHLFSFEQNTGALRFYERNGFNVCDRASVVPYELTHYTGDVLLMTAPV